ncbi:MAG: hypothetical protein KC485_11105 [Gemmatimonadetes bacterium]|nr:hypothetical protein [Gemmatimonadota bacterium]MCB9518066.1 hypothetical protein [Gemmatimonadales bacterium]HRX17407.1 hypothetical protein [Gemmatimonadales bacterium]
MKLPFARTLLASAAVAAGLMFIAPAQASAQLGFVVQANYGDDVEFGVGGGVRFGLGSLTEKQGIRGEATFDYYFPGGGQEFGTFSSDFDYWEINGNLLLDIKSVQGLYVGAGVNYANFSYNFDGCGLFCDSFDASSSDIGLNALGGYEFPGSKKLFVQAKIELGGGEQFVVSGGIRF